jgi:hypothetical protein
VIYSVYDPDRKIYDYYEAPGPRGTHATAPPVPLAQGQLGATVDQAAWKVPPGAKKIGAGDLPRGRIAAMGGLGDIVIGGQSVTRIAIFGALAYLAWRHFR